MESKELVVVDFCGTLVRDSKSIEKFILLLIKSNLILLLKFYFIKISNITLMMINSNFNLKLSYLSLYNLTKGFSKELISHKSKIYAKKLTLILREDIIKKLLFFTKSHFSIIVSASLYENINDFIDLIDLKFDVIYASRIMYDSNNISTGKVDIIYTGSKKLLPLMNHSYNSIISFGDSRNDLELFNVSNEVHLVYPKKRFKDSVISKGWIIHD